jgi:pyruvate dehydrogenase E1 component alpha subunit
MRRMEQAADALYKQKLIRGFCHLAIGQEAVSVGMEAAIDGDDRVITSYRCHTFAVLRGGTMKGVLAELMGEFSVKFLISSGYSTRYIIGHCVLGGLITL